MNYAPGGWIPPIGDGDASVPAVLSEGEAWAGASAVKRYGAGFFANIGGIPAANVHPLPEDDVIVHSGPAECGDTTGLQSPFGQHVCRYRWRFTACGVAVTHLTDAAGLRLHGQVVSRQPALAGRPVTLVQLVDASGAVFASVQAMPDEATLRRLESMSRQPEHRDRAGDTHMRVGPCWCAPATNVGHVNEDGSAC